APHISAGPDPPLRSLLSPACSKKPAGPRFATPSSSAASETVSAADKMQFCRRSPACTASRDPLPPLPSSTDRLRATLHSEFASRWHLHSAKAASPCTHRPPPPTASPPYRFRETTARAARGFASLQNNVPPQLFRPR